jgi:hypothetical protein
MTLIRPAGTHPSYVRCYSLAWRSRVQHLESVAKFPSQREIEEVMREHNVLTLAGERSALFIHQAHLPDDLLAVWSDLEGFHRFCEIIAFSMDIYELRLDGDPKSSLPLELNDPAASRRPCSGFAVTLPTIEVERRNSFSFGVGELQDFLGDLTCFAGKMAFLRLRHPFENRNMTPQEHRNELSWIIRELAASHPEEIILH